MICFRRLFTIDVFPHTVDINSGASRHVTAFPQKPDSVINVTVEFGEGEGKVSLDNIAKRAEAYKPKK